MARSGSTNFIVTRDDIIKYALQDIGVITGLGSNPTAEQITHAAWKLNVMVKKDMTQGLHLWALTEGTLFLVDGQESYSLGVGGDPATSSYVKTELSSDGAAGSLTIDVDSITGISSGHAIGVELDDGTLHWTTVNGAPAGTTVTLTVALASVASIDNHVYAYNTIIEKPLRILKETVRIELGSGAEMPVTLVSRAEYVQLSDKSTTGKCNQVYYDPQYGALGTLYAWPTCDDVKDVLHFTFERTLQDFDAATDNPDFPIEATDYLVKGLRYELAGAYGVPGPRRQELRDEAREARDDWLDWDSENSSVFLQPDLR